MIASLYSRIAYWGTLGICIWICSSRDTLAQSSPSVFELGFDAPREVSVEESAGIVDIDVFSTLNTHLDGDDGAQGWTVGIRVTGCTIAFATTDGTAGDLDENEGYRNSKSSFEHTELTTGSGNVGVVSGVGLSFLEPMTLPPSGSPHTLLKLTLQAGAPSIPGQCSECTLSYVDGLQGSGQPIDNEITFQTLAVVPKLNSKTINVCTNAFKITFDAPVRVGTEIPGGTADFEVVSVLESRLNEDAGAEGWTLGINSAGCSIVDATTDGTAGGAKASGGYRRIGDSFEFTEIVSDSAVISGVVLSFSESIALPPSEGPHELLRLRLQATAGTVPGECSECTLSYVDGLVGSGEPIDNEITYQDQAFGPTMQSANIDVCANAFKISFDAPGELRTNRTTTFEASSLVHTRLTGNDGASAWELGLAAQGCRIVSASTAGTIAEVTSNGGLRTPDGSFEFTELTTGEGNEGVVSGVILSFADDVTLSPANSPHTLLKITVEGAPPTDGTECAPCTLSYVDGLSGSGQSVANQITFMSQAFQPSRESSTIDLCGVPFSLGLDAPERVTSRDRTNFDVTSVLTTAGTNAGAESWSIGIVADGCTIASATTAATAADLEANGGFRQPDNDGFELTELTTGNGNEGVTSSVVLSFSEEATLTPGESPHKILNINVEMDAPAESGACNNCTLSYQNGLLGSNGRVSNTVTNANGSSTPLLSGHTTEVCAVAYEFDFDGPTRIQGRDEVDVNVSGMLITAPDSDSSVNGWTMGVVADGCRVTHATTSGTAADLEANGGLLKPGEDGFELTELTTGNGNEGVVSSVVLSFSLASALSPAEGPHTVLDLGLQAAMPADPEECSECTLSYVDGLVGSSGPIDNTVKIPDETVRPRVTSHVVEFCSVPYEYAFVGPSRVTAMDTVDVEVSSILITTSNAREGARGWSIGIAASGCAISRATTSGTVADVIANHGLRQPGDDGFELTELVNGPAGAGVVSVVTLSVQDDVTLAPQDSPHMLLNLSVEAEAPATGGECRPCTLEFKDGLMGTGDPVINRVDLNSGTSAPRLSSKTIDVCARTFSLGFDAPDRITTADTTEFQVDGILTSDVETPNGAQAWSIGIAADGCSIASATTSGTIADLEENGGLRKPGEDGFELTEVVPNAGAMSSVVLSFADPVNLNPAESPHSIVKLTVEAALDEGQTDCHHCVLSFVDGLSGSTGRIDNDITYSDESFPPELGTKTIDICSDAGSQMPGDIDQDAGVDISDAVRLLGHLFLANPTQLPCEAGSGAVPGVIQLADWNGDQRVNISDPISMVTWLFGNGKPHVTSVLNEGKSCVIMSGCPNVCP